MTTHRVILRAWNLQTAPPFNTYEEFGAQASAFKEARRLARGLPHPALRPATEPGSLRALRRLARASLRPGGTAGDGWKARPVPSAAGCPGRGAGGAGGPPRRARRGGPGSGRAPRPTGHAVPCHTAGSQNGFPAPTKPAGSEGSDPASRSLPCHSEAEFEFTGRGRLSQPTAFNPLVAPAERVRLRRAEGTRRWRSFQL